MIRPADNAVRDPKLDLLRYLSVETRNGLSPIDDILESISGKLQALLNISRVGAFLLLSNEEPVPVRSKRPKPSLPEHIDKVLKSLDSSDRNPSLISIDVDGVRFDTLVLSLLFREHRCYVLLLQNEARSNEPSFVTRGQLYDWCSTLSDQLSLLLTHRIAAYLQRTKSDLLRQMLEDEKLFDDEAWYTITAAIPHFLPDWGQASLDPPPRAQLFTFDPEDRTFSLRGDTSSKSGVARMIFPAEHTIAGILVTNTSRGDRPNYVVVDPSRSANRYRKYLHNNRPSSELLVAIRQKDELLGVINIEYTHKNALSTLHLSVLLDAAAFIAPFVHAILSEAQRRWEREIVSVYVHNRTIRRLISSYLHKISNSIPLIGSALRELERSLGGSDRPESKNLEEIRQSVLRLTRGAKDILSGFPIATSIQPVDIVDAVRWAVGELSSSPSESVEFVVRTSLKNQMVLASGILREHIYNLLRNATDSILLAIHTGRIARGRVFITIEQLSTVQAEVPIVPRRVVLRIADNGIGVSSDLADRIFEYGFTTKGAGGSGFGLPAAREYARFLGGDLLLENDGNGATFVMILQEYTPQYHDRLVQHPGRQR